MNTQQSELPMGAVMQVLEDGKWCDVITRARTLRGMIKVYNKMSSPSDPPYGMRIITVHMEKLGRFDGFGLDQTETIS